MTNEKKAPAYSEAHRAYLRALRRKDHFVTAMRYLLLLFCLALWELAARVGWIDPFIGSSPSRLWAAILRLYQAGELWGHIGVTLLETVVGFIAGTLLGTLAAVFLWWSATLNRILDPYLVILNALPKLPWAPF